MRNRRFHAGLKKRAVCAGLFLGMLCGLFGCVKPGPIAQPVATKTPVPSPTEAVAPMPTSAPEITETPTPTVRPVKPIPEATATPEPEVTMPISEITPTPELQITITPVPEITVTPEPEAKSTPEPQATVSPEPEVTVTRSPEITVTPEPEITVTPEPEIMVTPEPEVTPTPAPDYNALLQNGWQRTEDFFGCREIYFSGQFTETELIAEEGYYEYRYTKTGDATTYFSLIGETALLQGLLDELAQKGTECVILQEEDSLYSYVYAEDGMVVKGRVYACVAEDAEHRMRAELHYPVGEEEKSEGYDFYLR